jgi:hypothetical protein
MKLRLLFCTHWLKWPLALDGASVFASKKATIHLKTRQLLSTQLPDNKACLAWCARPL